MPRVIDSPRFPLFLLFCACFLILTASPSRAMTVVRAPAGAVDLDLAGALEVRRSAVDAGMAQALTATDWQANTRRLSNFGESPQALWLRFRLETPNAPHPPLYVRYGYPSMDYADIWFLSGNRPVAHWSGGDRRPFVVRPVDDRLMLFPVPEAAGPLDVYIRLQSGGPLEAPLSLVDANTATADEHESMFWIGLYFGVIAIMVLYNGFILLMVRNAAYLYYVLYVLCSAALQFLLFGLGFRYLWPESTTLNNTLTMITPALVFFTAISFVMRFVGVREIGTRFENRFATLLYLVCGLLLLSSLTLPYAVTLNGYKAMMFVSVATGFYLGVKYWLKGVKSARIFALAWFSYLVFILAYLLEMTGVIHSGDITRNALAIGSTLELALLSIAFADKMNDEKDKRLRAQNDLLETHLRMNADLDRMVRERTEALELANRQLQEASVTDGLTHMRNRRFFEETSHAEYQRAYREKTCLSVLMVDIDHFKQVNDTYGHQFGDLCLQRAAELILASLKRAPDLAARYGGEEFVVLLPNTTPDGALTVAQQIHRTFANHEITDGTQSLRLTVSIGLAGEVPEQREGRERLLKKADDYLYVAKRTGRNRVIWDGNAEEAHGAAS